MTDRLMFDSVTVDQYPPDATMALAYVCGSFANYDAVKARCRHADVRTICVDALHVADELDVETGAATPADAPGWIVRMRGLKRRPVVYCSRTLVGTVQFECAKHGVSDPFWHMADWTGKPHLFPGSVATQFSAPTLQDPAYPGNVDVSLVSPNYPDRYQRKDVPVTIPKLTWPVFYRAVALAGSVIAYVVAIGNQLHLPIAVRTSLVAAASGIAWIEHHKVTGSAPPKSPPPTA